MKTDNANRLAHPKNIYTPGLKEFNWKKEQFIKIDKTKMAAGLTWKQTMPNANVEIPGPMESWKKSFKKKLFLGSGHFDYRWKAENLIRACPYSA